MSRPHSLVHALYQRRMAEACARIAGLDYAINSLADENADEWLDHVEGMRAAEAGIGAVMLALSSAWERDHRAYGARRRTNPSSRLPDDDHDVF